MGKLERTTIIIDDELWKEFKMQAIKEGTATYKLLTRIIESYLKEQKPSGKEKPSVISSLIGKIKGE
jgi:hypothetical protein